MNTVIVVFPLGADPVLTVTTGGTTLPAERNDLRVYGSVAALLAGLPGVLWQDYTGKGECYVGRSSPRPPARELPEQGYIAWAVRLESLEEIRAQYEETP